MPPLNAKTFTLTGKVGPSLLTRAPSGGIGGSGASIESGSDVSAGAGYIGSATALFTETFAGGIEHGNSSFAWGTIAANSPNSVQIVQQPDLSYAKRFRYGASTIQCEQRFRFPTRRPEFYLREVVTIPSNFTQGGSNNKFFTVWDSPATITDGNDGYTQAVGPGCAINIMDLKSDSIIADAVPFWFGGGGTIDSAGITTTKLGPADPWDNGPAILAGDIGQKVEFLWHHRQATAADNNGWLRGWIRRGGVVRQIFNITTARSYGAGQLGFSNGYLFGWRNSVMAAQCDFLLHELNLSLTDIWGISS